jgi:HB1, ASXL, restriction endonuclease HTH domain
MPTCIQYLPIGTRFRLACEPHVTGTLTGLSDCSAAVRLHGAARDVVIEETTGETRRFRATPSRTTTWALATLVEPILYPEDDQSSNHEENAMSTKTATKKTGTKKAAKSKAPATTKAPAKDKATKKAKASDKLSALDAAAKVLGEAKEPMNTKAMIEAMAAKGYWTSPGGKTPHATLYSAILREIDIKGTDARFKKTERGMFALKG